MMNEYTIRCTEEQTKKALALGAPIELESEYYHPTENDFKLNEPIPCESFAMGYHYAKCPTAEQMIGFLRSKGIKFHFDDGTMYWKVTNKSRLIGYGWSEEKKELAAIDAALNYLKTHQTT